MNTSERSDVHLLLRFIDAHLAVDIANKNDRKPDPQAIMDSTELIHEINAIKIRTEYKTPTYTSGRFTKP